MALLTSLFQLEQTILNSITFPRKKFLVASIFKFKLCLIFGGGDWGKRKILKDDVWFKQNFLDETN
jgi:hypothetical protein